MKIDIGNISSDLKDVAEFVGYVIVGILASMFGVFKKKAKKYIEDKKQKNFLKVISQSSLLRDLLVEVRTVYKADRGMLFQIKNGEYYISGESDQKLCLTHLVNAHGISFLNSVGTTYQNMPVGLSARTLAKVIQEGFYTSSLTLDNIDCYLHSVLFSDGHKKFAMVPALNLRNQVVGVIVLVWNNESRDIINCEELRSFGHKIGATLINEN